jgi:HEAT repeat protein
MRSRFVFDVRVVTRVLWVLCASLVLTASLSAADESVAKLTADLKSGDEKARVAAIDALGNLGAGAKDATPTLAELLTPDNSPIVRAHAAHALMQIGVDAASAAPALAKAISDPDFHVQRMAIAALERIHPDPKVVIEALGKALADSDPSVRIAALHTLTEYSDAAVPVLGKALENKDTRYWSALALGELGVQAKGAVPALAAALADERPEVRRELLIALARVGADAAPAVPAIVPLLQDKDESVAHAAGFALGSIGPGAASATDALRKAIDGKDELEECVNSWALARIEPQNAEAREHAIKLLLETVKDKNPRVQIAAMRALIDLKVPPKQLVPALAYVVLNGEEPAVGEALGALGMLGDAATEVLDDALTRPEARGRAALLITYLGPKAKATVPALGAALVDKDADVRRELLFALAAMGPDAAPAAPAIIKSLDDSNASNQAVAAYALGKIGPAAKAGLPRLQEELTSADPLVRVASAFALVHVAPNNEPLARSAVPVLVQGLASPVAAARRGAAEALGEVGKSARAAAEKALKSATTDSDETVRKAALEALEKMGVVVDAPPAVN